MKIQAKQLEQDLQSGKRVTLIDVRTPVEHEEMHIEGSRLMPLGRLDVDTVKSAIGEGGCCVVICQSGKRAEQAFKQLQAAGCGNITILDGGVSAWDAAGLPLKRSGKNRLSLMRQVHLTIGLCVLTGSILAFTVDKNYALISAIFGAGLTLAGATGWCGLALVLSKMPWNRVECGGCSKSSCSV